jgi:hypothetical protein
LLGFDCRDALNFLQLGAEAVVIRTKADNALELAVTKTWLFRPGAPFVGDASVRAQHYPWL